MQNWSGLLTWNPSKICYPETGAAIQSIVQKAIQENQKIRVIGSGHSFTKLCVTNEILISLDKFQGVISINPENKEATFKAGTKLSLLNELLAKEKLALQNMGDVDVQSIAGAISTGTHGTGTTFGNLSTDVLKIKFINGLGEVVTCSDSKNPELFKAAQISLGTLGVLLEITVQCVDAYSLELKLEKEELSAVLENLETTNKNHRNFEFYWFPNTPYVMTKYSNITTKPADKASFMNYFQEMILENYAFKLMCEISTKFPATTRRLSKFGANTITSHSKVNYSHKVFSTTRIVRFNEMEYNVPIEAYDEVKKEVVNWINKYNYDIIFPLENRFVKGDDIYLSPAYQRDSAYIAAHAYSKRDYKKYFAALEDIYKAHDGRPHWGKMHTLTASELEILYPMFQKFKTFRAQQDPNGLFLSPYLKELFYAKNEVIA